MIFPKYDYSKEIINASRHNFCTPREEVELNLRKWDEGSTEDPSTIESNTVIKQTEEFEPPLI